MTTQDGHSAPLSAPGTTARETRLTSRYDQKEECIADSAVVIFVCDCIYVGVHFGCARARVCVCVFVCFYVYVGVRVSLLVSLCLCLYILLFSVSAFSCLL